MIETLVTEDGEIFEAEITENNGGKTVTVVTEGGSGEFDADMLISERCDYWRRGRPLIQPRCISRELAKELIEEAYDTGKASRVTDGWQPIETAPRDGTDILLLIEGEVIEGSFDRKLRRDGSSYAEPRWEVVSMNSHGCGCCSEPNPEPTHWMPLPATPKAGE